MAGKASKFELGLIERRNSLIAYAQKLVQSGALPGNSEYADEIFPVADGRIRINLEKAGIALQKRKDILQSIEVDAAKAQKNFEKRKNELMAQQNPLNDVKRNQADRQAKADKLVSSAMTEADKPENQGRYGSMGGLKASEDPMAMIEALQEQLSAKNAEPHHAYGHEDKQLWQTEVYALQSKIEELRSKYISSKDETPRTPRPSARDVRLAAEAEAAKNNPQPSLQSLADANKKEYDEKFYKIYGMTQEQYDAARPITDMGEEAEKQKEELKAFYRAKEKAIYDKWKKQGFGTYDDTPEKDKELRDLWAEEKQKINDLESKNPLRKRFAGKTTEEQDANKKRYTENFDTKAMGAKVTEKRNAQENVEKSKAVAEYSKKKSEYDKLPWWKRQVTSAPSDPRVHNTDRDMALADLYMEARTGQLPNQQPGEGTRGDRAMEGLRSFTGSLAGMLVPALIPGVGPVMAAGAASDILLGTKFTDNVAGGIGGSGFGNSNAETAGTVLGFAGALAAGRGGKPRSGIRNPKVTSAAREATENVRPVKPPINQLDDAANNARKAKEAQDKADRARRAKESAERAKRAKQAKDAEEARKAQENARAAEDAANKATENATSGVSSSSSASSSASGLGKFDLAAIRNIEERKIIKAFLEMSDLNPSSNKDEIIKAYRKLQMANHPDRGGSEEISKIINNARDLIGQKYYNKLFPNISESFAKGGIASYFANGGLSKGTDTIPAMLSKGEFVMQKSAVDKHGVGMMKHLNAGGSISYLGVGGMSDGSAGNADNAEKEKVIAELMSLDMPQIAARIGLPGGISVAEGKRSIYRAKNNGKNPKYTTAPQAPSNINYYKAGVGGFNSQGPLPGGGMSVGGMGGMNGMKGMGGLGGLNNLSSIIEKVEKMFAQLEQSMSGFDGSLTVGTKNIEPFIDQFGRMNFGSESTTITGPGKGKQGGCCEGINNLATVLEADNNRFIETVQQVMSMGGVAGYAQGGEVFNSIFKPRGTDTVPAMLTKGEFVIRKSAVDSIGLDNLHAINRAGGGGVKPQRMLGGIPTISNRAVPPAPTVKDAGIGLSAPGGNGTYSVTDKGLGGYGGFGKYDSNFYQDAVYGPSNPYNTYGGLPVGTVLPSVIQYAGNYQSPMQLYDQSLGQQHRNLMADTNAATSAAYGRMNNAYQNNMGYARGQASGYGGGFGGRTSRRNGIRQRMADRRGGGNGVWLVPPGPMGGGILRATGGLVSYLAKGGKSDEYNNNFSSIADYLPMGAGMGFGGLPVGTMLPSAIAYDGNYQSPMALYDQSLGQQHRNTMAATNEANSAAYARMNNAYQNNMGYARNQARGYGGGYRQRTNRRNAIRQRRAERNGFAGFAGWGNGRFANGGLVSYLAGGGISGSVGGLNDSMFDRLGKQTFNRLPGAIPARKNTVAATTTDASSSSSAFGSNMNVNSSGAKSYGFGIGIGPLGGSGLNWDKPDYKQMSQNINAFNNPYNTYGGLPVGTVLPSVIQYAGNYQSPMQLYDQSLGQQHRNLVADANAATSAAYARMNNAYQNNMGYARNQAAGYSRGFGARTNRRNGIRQRMADRRGGGGGGGGGGGNGFAFDSGQFMNGTLSMSSMYNRDKLLGQGDSYYLTPGLSYNMGYRNNGLTAFTTPTYSLGGLVSYLAKGGKSVSGMDGIGGYANIASMIPDYPKNAKDGDPYMTGNNPMNMMNPYNTYGGLPVGTVLPSVIQYAGNYQSPMQLYDQSLGQQHRNLMADTNSATQAAYDRMNNAYQNNMGYARGQAGRYQRGGSYRRARRNGFSRTNRGFADGGMVSFFANGGSLQDTVPAMLTPGEYVMSKEAVSNHGMGFMEHLNKGGGIKGFNTGGVVGATEYKAGGGMAGGGGGGSTSVNLNVDLASISSAISSSVQRAFSSLGNIINMDALNNLASTFSNLVDRLGSVAGSLSGMQMTHQVNIDGNVSISGLNTKYIAEAIKNEVGSFVTNEVIRLLNINDAKQF